MMTINMQLNEVQISLYATLSDMTVQHLRELNNAAAWAINPYTTSTQQLFSKAYILHQLPNHRQVSFEDVHKLSEVALLARYANEDKIFERGPLTTSYEIVIDSSASLAAPCTIGEFDAAFTRFIESRDKPFPSV